MSKIRSKKTGILTMIILILIIIISIPSFMQKRDADFIKSRLSEVSLPTKFQLQSAEKGSSELATVMRYHYLSSVDTISSMQAVETTLHNQGFKVSSTSHSVSKSTGLINASNSSKQLHLSVRFSPGSVEIEATKCGSVCEP